jgi:hypothetical protein
MQGLAGGVDVPAASGVVCMLCALVYALFPSLLAGRWYALRLSHIRSTSAQRCCKPVGSPCKGLLQHNHVDPEGTGSVYRQHMYQTISCT